MAKEYSLSTGILPLGVACLGAVWLGCRVHSPCFVVNLIQINTKMSKMGKTDRRSI